MSEWFCVDQIDEDTYCISEYRHWEETHCYVLNGTKHTLLIDTGLGIQNIYDVVMKVAKKPIICIATHIHWDHIGSHSSFPVFYVHEKELEWVRGKFPLPLDVVKNQWSIVAICLRNMIFQHIPFFRESRHMLLRRMRISTWVSVE